MSATFRSHRRVALAILACVLLALLPTRGAAQEPVTSFDQLNTRLKVGDTVWVTDAHGREVKGTIRGISSDTLMLDSDGAQTIPAADVRSIGVWERDSLTNGMLIGLAVGAVGGGVVDTLIYGWEGAGYFMRAALLGAGVGAALGAVIDYSFHGTKRDVYRVPGSQGAARLSFAPVITSRAKGVVVAFAF